jgi:tRNA(fMet)-specific endonuclease VapC
MRYCLDTSAYSQFKRGDAQVVELIDRAEWIGVPVIVLGELATGFRLSARRAANEAELDAFLANPAVDVLEVNADIAGIYADLALGLKSAGTPLPSNDLWIAATAVRHGAPVLTYDTHFHKIPRAGATVLAAPRP